MNQSLYIIEYPNIPSDFYFFMFFFIHMKTAFLATLIQ